MSWLKQLQQAWDALDYADVAGEFLLYSEKCRILGVEPPPNGHGYLPPREITPRRAVALNLSRDLAPLTISYAISMAQRLQARVMLLRPPHGSASPSSIRAVQERLTAEGVPWEEETLSLPWMESMLTFLRHHSEVVCLVLGPSDLEPRLMAPPSPVARRPWRFPAPVVVVHGDMPLPQPA